jgi:hypothetical protein
VSYAEGYRNGRLDRNLGICNDYAFHTGGDYGRGYRDGVLGLAERRPK